MSKDLVRMLNTPEKGVREAKGPLAKLFRQILADLNVTPMKFDNLMKKYVTDPRNSIPQDGRSRSSARGNLVKVMQGPEMTWKNFMRCIRFLDPVEARFEVHLKWRNKTITVHGFTILISPEEEMSQGQVTKKQSNQNHEEPPEQE